MRIFINYWTMHWLCTGISEIQYMFKMTTEADFFGQPHLHPVGSFVGRKLQSGRHGLLLASLSQA